MKKALAVAVMAAFAWSAAQAGEVAAPSGANIQISPLIKALYTYRKTDDRSGVTGISEAAIRWIELDFYGQTGKVSYRLDLVGSQGIYHDPIYDTGTVALATGEGFGTVGIRQARIDLNKFVPWTTVTVGTFMPGWGIYQDRNTSDWDFVDLPLIYTQPAFHALGWQNTGVALKLEPIEQIKLEGYYINGYFPQGLANGEPMVPGGGYNRDKVLGGRLTLGAGPVSAWGAYMSETWQEDVRGGPAAEDQKSVSWIAGMGLTLPKLWVLFEWTDLIIEDYQLRTDGTWVNLRSYGGHASVGWTPLEAWEVLARWEWFDPNDSNSKGTFNRSRFDQVTQWTVGVNYRIAPFCLIMADFVMPEEEGQHIDLEKGKVGGRYQQKENNYLRIQVQVWN